MGYSLVVSRIKITKQHKITDLQNRSITHDLSVRYCRVNIVSTRRRGGSRVAGSCENNVGVRLQFFSSFLASSWPISQFRPWRGKGSLGTSGSRKVSYRQTRTNASTSVSGLEQNPFLTTTRNLFAVSFVRGVTLLNPEVLTRSSRIVRDSERRSERLSYRKVISISSSECGWI